MGSFQPGGFGMGKRIAGDADGQYWKNVEKAMPLIKQRADQIITTLGYNPTQLTAKVFEKGEEGDEVWTVAYWETSSEKYRGDVEVYLNNQGRVRRVVRFQDGQERLVYGKNERLTKGMTFEQVREKLGEPDRKSLPPRELRDLDDEMWIYKATPAGRTMRIEVYFKGGKVSSWGYFGE